MPLPTTVIGSYPKPDYLQIPDWFRLGKSGRVTFGEYSEFIHKTNEEGKNLKSLLEKATKDVLKIQEEIGVDVISDGEMPRESYVHYYCRRLNGIDFDQLTEKSARNGAWVAPAPTITGKVEPKDPNPWVHLEWQQAQRMTETPVKATLPGPMSMSNSLYDSYYNNDVELNRAFVKTLNKEIVALAEAGCKYIQVDEPMLVRSPDKALEYGIDHLAACFEGIPKSVSKCIHLCCGYPVYLDQEDYEKADASAYLKIADKLDDAGFDYISIEDAHKQNDLELFKHFKKSKIVVGVIKVASSKIESVQEIRDRLQQILTVIPAHRVTVAPDCGLAFLPPSLAVQKLKNMVEAAKSLP